MTEQTVPFLETQIDAVMTRNPQTVEPEASLADAADLFLQGGFRHLPVVNADGRLVGMLSERDMRVKLGTRPESFPSATLEALSEPVSSAMSPDPITVEPTATLSQALEVFADERVGALLAAEGGEKLVGVLSYIDVLSFLNRQANRSAQEPAGGKAGLPLRGKASAAAPARERPARRRAKKPARRVSPTARRTRTQAARKAKPKTAARKRGRRG